MRKALFVLVVVSSTMLGLGAAHAQRDAAPRTMLWVWHGAHDLRGLPASVGVAYLARTVRVRADGTTDVAPRRQPLVLDDRTIRWGVLRIELDGGADVDDVKRAIDVLAGQAAIVAGERGVRALQIDFDAPRSIRPAYIDLLRHVRRVLRPGQALSITALGSWCVSDRWLASAGADVIVPMLFGRGHDVLLVQDVLASTRALPEPRCRPALGVREGDALPVGAATAFVFPRRPWTLERAIATAR